VASAPELIADAYRHLVAEMPALERLKLVLRLELRGRGDVQIFRVAMPGPEVSKVDPEDARIEVAMPRASFNEAAEKGTISAWHDAYDHGDLKVGGDPDVIKLLGTVIAKHEARGQLRRVR
jgi:hypothetical protein